MNFSDDGELSEIEMVSTENVCISRLILSAPKTLTLLKSVSVSAQCHAVCYHNGKTYAGCIFGHVDLIDENYQVTASFLKLPGDIRAVTVFNDTIYVLWIFVRMNKFKVNKYNFSGDYIGQWGDTLEKSCGGDNLVIVSGMVITPDTKNKELTVYSLDGGVLKHIPCPLSERSTSLCALGADSVIVSDFSSSQVFRISILTGDTLWTCRCAASPLSVASYGEDFALVWGKTAEKIFVLDAGTGKLW